MNHFESPDDLEVLFENFVNQMGKPGVKISCGGTEAFLENITAELLNPEITERYRLVFTEMETHRRELIKQTSSLNGTEMALNQEPIVPRPEWLTLDYKRAKKLIKDLVQYLSLTPNQETLLLLLARLFEVEKLLEAVNNHSSKQVTPESMKLLVAFLLGPGGVMELLENIINAAPLDDDDREVILDQLNKHKPTIVKKSQELWNIPIYYTIGVLTHHFTDSVIGMLLDTQWAKSKLRKDFMEDSNVDSRISRIGMGFFAIFHDLQEMYESYDYPNPREGYSEMKNRFPLLGSEES